MKIVTADGRIIDRAHANAWQADTRMEGVRIDIRLDGGNAKAKINVGDMDAIVQWTQQEVSSMLARIEALAMAGDLAMIDEEGVEAWLA